MADLIPAALLAYETQEGGSSYMDCCHHTPLSGSYACDDNRGALAASSLEERPVTIRKTKCLRRTGGNGSFMNDR